MAHDAGSDNPYTRGIAKFVSGLTFDAIPDEVRTRIKLLMLDSLGCALYGADLEWTRILQDTLGRIDTTRSAAVWGTPLKLSAPHAALVNGTQVQGFELDDVHRAGVLHVGAVVLPALISITELKPGMSGKEFLTAAVAGYEIGPRVGLCMGPEHIAQGWHSGATLGVFSAASGAARGLKLDPDKTVHALGIAGTQAAGLMAAQYGAMVKRMHAGRSSQSGLYGALFAEAGFTGIVNVLESEYGGYCTTFSRSTDRFNLKELTAGLGEVWQTMGVALKFYACVGSNHTTLDALREMKQERPYQATDVEKIVVRGSQVTMDHVGWKYVPQGLTSAQLNLPYCIGTYLLEGDCGVDQFTEGKVADPERIAYGEKVEVHHDADITAKGPKFRHMVRVELHLKDGTRMERTVESARGSEYKFASEADIVEKFEKLASKAIPQKQLERLRDAMLGLEKLTDATDIARLLARSWNSVLRHFAADVCQRAMREDHHDAVAQVDCERLWARHMEMAQIGAIPGNGVNRAAFSAEDIRARHLLVAWAKARDFSISVDAIGNLFVRRAGTDVDATPVMSGSHMDSQPCGGRFDGIYGVLAALEALEAIDAAGLKTRRPIELVAWSNEEGGRFQPCTMGSAVYTGARALEDFIGVSDNAGVVLRDALAETIKALPEAEPRPLNGAAAAYIETHIEQGPLLEAQGKTIGIVTGIQGLRWFNIEVSGKTDHAGTTPLRLRKDALRSAIQIINALEALTRDPHDIVRFTVGRLLVTPNSPNSVPSHVLFSVDIRHPELQTISTLGAAVEPLAQKWAGACEVKVIPTLHDDPCVFDSAIVDTIERAADDLTLTHMRLPSGASHDAMYMSRVCPTGMIFVPCEHGISHNEAENAKPEDLAAGARVLTATLLELANH